MKKETIARLIKDYSGDDLAEYLSSVLEEEKTLKQEISRLSSREDDDKKRHVKILEGFREEWRNIRKRCHHYEFTFCPDPSGGNDSEYICDMCGASMDNHCR